MASPRSTSTKRTLPTQQSTLGSRAWMRRKHPCPERANKVVVAMSSRTGTQKKTKFLYCPLLSPFLSTYIFWIGCFHKASFSLYSYSHRQNVQDRTTERKKEQTQKEKHFQVFVSVFTSFTFITMKEFLLSQCKHHWFETFQDDIVGQG